MMWLCRQPSWERHVPHTLRLYWPIIQRALVTLLMLGIVRMGYFIPLPGVDLASLPVNTAATEGETVGGFYQTSNMARGKQYRYVC
jgi:preprotein translocase subunit SecY